VYFAGCEGSWVDYWMVCGGLARGDL